jgi:hypothetical protein
MPSLVTNPHPGLSRTTKTLALSRKDGYNDVRAECDDGEGALRVIRLRRGEGCVEAFNATSRCWYIVLVVTLDYCQSIQNNCAESVYSKGAVQLRMQSRPCGPLCRNFKLIFQLETERRMRLTCAARNDPLLVCGDRSQHAQSLGPLVPWRLT